MSLFCNNYLPFLYQNGFLFVIVNKARKIQKATGTKQKPNIGFVSFIRIDYGYTGGPGFRADTLDDCSELLNT